MKRRALIVEDDPFLALDLVEELSLAGLDVVGPAATSARALSIIEDCGCDVAVLDVHLGGELSTPVANDLRTRGIPFVILTGYSSEQLPTNFAGAPVLSKPARGKDIIAQLETCLRQRSIALKS